MKSNFQPWMGWALFILAIIVGLVLISVFSSPGSQNGKANVEVTEQDWVKGSNDAKVTIVEYSDFQCPGCRSYAPLLSQLVDELGDHVRVVYRHFPLPIHPHAPITAQAAEAAGLQGKFWEMHDVIFDMQRDWSESSDIETLLIGYAANIGLDVEKFKTDLYSQDVKNAVEDDTKSGVRAPVRATPTIILDGEILSPNPGSYAALRDLVVSTLGDDVVIESAEPEFNVKSADE